MPARRWCSRRRSDAGPPRLVPDDAGREVTLQDHTASRQDEHTLVQACRRGDLHACETLVGRYQSEVLRTALLLTGDRQAAARAALETFWLAFRHLRGIGERAEFRPWLLDHLVRVCLYSRPASAAWPGIETDVPVAAAAERAVVDDERSRARAALGRLSGPERAALVLHEFNGLSTDQVREILDWRENSLLPTLKVARDRVWQSTGQSGGTVQAALAAASIDAPRLDLWSRLESPVARQHARERDRSRRIVAGVTGVAAILLAGILVLLFGDGLFEGDAASDTGSLSEATMTAPAMEADEAIVGPEGPTGTNTASQSPAPSTIADVPGALLVHHDDRVYPYDFENDSNGRGVAATDLPKISPDGEHLVFVRIDGGNETLRVDVAMHEADDMTRLWETEVVDLQDLSGGQAQAFSIDVAVTESRVYVVHRAWQVTQPITIVALDRASGDVRREQTVDLSGPVTGTLGLFTAPDESELYLFVSGQWRDYVGRLDYFRFSLPEMEIIRRVQPVRGTPEPHFFFWHSRTLVDGSGLYRVNYAEQSPAVAVRFFNFETATIEELELPFGGSQEQGLFAFEWATSHDGRHLYVLAPTRGQVAIVDLAERAIERTVPLDFGQFRPESVQNPPWRAIGVPTGSRMHLSPDGERLYAIGIAYDSVGHASSAGAWVIDTTTWTVVDHWMADTAVTALVLEGDRLAVLEPANYSGPDPLDDRTLHLLDMTTGREILSDRAFRAGEGTVQAMAGIYRRHYGHSPSVNGSVPRDNRDFSSLAAISVMPGSGSPAPDEPLPVEVWFVDPDTGAPVTEGATNVRYRPPESVTLVFSAPDVERIIVVPVQTDYGVYSGTVQLPEPGAWNLEVVVQRADGSERRQSFPDVVSVTPPAGALGQPEPCRPYAAQVEAARCSS